MLEWGGGAAGCYQGQGHMMRCVSGREVMELSSDKELVSISFAVGNVDGHRVRVCYVEFVSITNDVCSVCIVII